MAYNMRNQGDNSHTTIALKIDSLACGPYGVGRYVSCNPATLGRDLSGLSQRGYKLTRVRPVNLFPQTFHAETLAEMAR